MKAKVIAVRPIKRPRPRVICITGTPVSESPINAYPLLKIIEPSIVTSKTKFESVFIEYKTEFIRGKKVKKVIGYKNLDKLRELLSTVSIRRTLDQVRGMPEKVWIERHVELSQEERRTYSDMVFGVASGLRNSKNKDLSSDDISALTLRLRQFINDPQTLGSSIAGSKIAELERIVEEVLEDPQAKMIVWSNFVDPLSRLVCRFAEYNPIAIDANTDSDTIARLSREFDHNNCRIIFLTPQKGGTGLDFLSRARTAVYMDLPWSYTNFAQSQDRLVRRTNVNSDSWLEKLKGSPATLIRLHAPDTVDDLVFELLMRKVAMAQAATKVSLEDIKLKTEEILQLLGARVK